MAPSSFMARRDEDLDLNEEAEMSRLESGEPEDEPPPEPVRVPAPASRLVPQLAPDLARDYA
jgi:hypothetical protein